MIIYRRTFLMLLFVFILNAVGRGQVLREDHDYLWQDKGKLRNLNPLDILENLSKYVPVVDTSYYKSLIYLLRGYQVPAKKAIQEHANRLNHHYPYETKIILGLANSSVYYTSFGHFLDAIAMDPDRAEGYLEKMKVFSSQKDYLDGIDHANEAIRLFPDKLELYVFRGNLYVHQGLRKRAFRDFKKVIDSRRPLSDFFMVQAHRGLAWGYLGRNDITHAEIHLMESRIMEPDHPFAMGLLAEICFLSGNPKGAIDAFESILGTENRENYLLMMGFAHEELDQKEKACDFFKQCCLRELPLACKKLKELNCAE